jgi:hypothetical protein
MPRFVAPTLLLVDRDGAEKGGEERVSIAQRKKQGFFCKLKVTVLYALLLLRLQLLQNA